MVKLLNILFSLISRYIIVKRDRVSYNVNVDADLWTMTSEWTIAS